MSVIETAPALDPKKAECVGFFLYGSGYYSRTDRTAGVLAGERRDASFCNECPVKAKCERIHEQRVQREEPEKVEAFERRCRKAARRGMSPLMVKAALMKQGDPDPYMARALANYKRGYDDFERMRSTPAG